MIHKTSRSRVIGLRNLYMVIGILGLVFFSCACTGCRKGDTPADAAGKKPAVPETKPANVEETDELRTHSESLDGMNIDKVCELIDAGADVNVANGNRMTALYMAARTGHLDIVKLLLAHNADPNIVNSEGQSSVNIAKLHRHTAMVKLLKKHGGKE